MARQNTAMETAHWGRADAGPAGGDSAGARCEQGRLCWGLTAGQGTAMEARGGGGGGGGREAFGIVTENEPPSL